MHRITAEEIKQKKIKTDINKIEKVWYKNSFGLIPIKLLLLQLEGDENVLEYSLHLR